jgi:uncharacterized protein YndB with AHSA1/START domain/predicted transcriptional regulator YdeE
MPKIELEKSVEIDASVEKLFAIISDLANWRPWNPWLITDSEAAVDVESGGKSYSWNGKRTGSGRMQIISEQRPSSVELDLTFLKPFKSHAKVGFKIEPHGEGSKVTWSMQSSLPFFMLFMKNMMTTMIGMDYERGLTMLKDYAESGSVPSRIVERGESAYPGCKYVGISTECPLSEIGPRMSADFDKLREWQASAGIRAAADPFTTYRKWELAKGRVSYTCGIPVETLPANLPASLETGEIPQLKTYVLEHVGPYRHLGNAWSAGMQMGRGKEFRPSKAHAPFEVYPLAADGGLPSGDSDEATRTEIRFAVR